MPCRRWSSTASEMAHAALAYADFSLHLAPGDLDVLSVVAADRVGVEPLLLRRCLIGEVGIIGNGAGGGADVVDPAWVEMVAALDEADSGEVTARWIGAVEAYGEDLAVTEAAVRAVGSLIRLCKAAQSGRAQVIHVWYLSGRHDRGAPLTIKDWSPRSRTSNPCSRSPVAPPRASR